MDLDKFLNNPKFTILATIFNEDEFLLINSVESKPYLHTQMANKNNKYKKMFTIYLTEDLPSQIEIDYRYLHQKYYLIPDPESKIHILYHPGILFEHRSMFKHIAFYGPYTIKYKEDNE